ncbi:MAG TPA: sortase [Patescibacteria group bacterium]|nr:sortase [Patescibacteria group bacterium]
MQIDKKLIRRVVIKLTLAVGLVLLLWVASNFEYFWKNLDFLIRHPQAAPIETKPQETMTPNEIIIPSLGITAPLQYASGTSEQEFQDLLAQGVVHYPGTSLPGEAGNAYFFGHSSDYAWSKGKFKTVFALLPRIGIGDSIVISNSQGQKFTYVVQRKMPVSTNAVQYLSQGDKSQTQLTLQTSYPVGTALERYIVIASLKQ